MPNFILLDKVEDEFLKRILIFVPIQTGHRQISIKLSSLFHFSLVGSSPPIDNKFLCILCAYLLFSLAPHFSLRFVPSPAIHYHLCASLIQKQPYASYKSNKVEFNWQVGRGLYLMLFLLLFS